MDRQREKTLQALFSRHPGMYSARLGIKLDSASPEALFCWLVASVLYGARISGGLAERTYREFESRGLLDPERIIGAGWDGLVAALDAGGYVRYDYKTADKLLELSNNLINDYSGDLGRLHKSAQGPPALEAGLKALAKGVGDVTVNIFLRELRGVWEKAAPPPSPLAVSAARRLGLIRGRASINALREAWGEGLPGRDFRDFEAALVSEGLEQRRKKVA